MTARKFEKALISCLSWAIFLYLLISNWDALKSAQWRDLWETIKISGIGDIIKWNVGYFLLFSLTILFMALYVRHIRKRQFASKDHDAEEENRRRDRLHSPAYSALGGNIHYDSDNYTTDKAFEEK